MVLKTTDIFKTENLNLKKMNNIMNTGSLNKRRTINPIINHQQRKILVGNKSNLVSKY